MKVLGLDISTKVGWAVADSEDIGTVTYDTIVAPKGSDGFERVRHLVQRVHAVAETFQPALTVVEGYAFAAKGNSLTKLVEVGAVCRWDLFEHDYRWIDAPPSTVKKFWTGNGGASKVDMLYATWERYGTQVTDDEADAIALATFGLALLGHVDYGGKSAEAVKIYLKSHPELKSATG